MTARKAFYDTTVNTSNTQNQVEDLLHAHEVEAIRWTILLGSTMLEFKHPQGSFRIVANHEMGDHPKKEQRRRQVMRALHWHVKAKLDAIDFGLETFTTAFLPYLLLEDGRTMGDRVVEARAAGHLASGRFLPEGQG